MTTNEHKAALTAAAAGLTDEQMPALPRPAVTYADHSYPAFNAKQMRDYARAALASLAPAGLETLTRYGFDGTLGGDFGEEKDGPYVRLADVERWAASHAAPVGITAEQFEEIAQSWDGCEGEGIDDIGAALRADFKRLASHAGAAAEPSAYLHQVVCGDGEPDQALSFAPDNFPLAGTLGYRSISYAPLYLAATSSEEVRNQVLEEAALAAEKVEDDYRERQSRKWPEMRDDAETGARDCATAIRELKSQSASAAGGSE